MWSLENVGVGINECYGEIGNCVGKRKWGKGIC